MWMESRGRGSPLMIIIILYHPGWEAAGFEENSCSRYPLSPPWYIHPAVRGGKSLWEFSEICYWVIKMGFVREGEQKKPTKKPVKSTLATFSFLIYFHSWLISIVLKEGGSAYVNLHKEQHQKHRRVCHLFPWLINHILYLCLGSPRPLPPPPPSLQMTSWHLLWSANHFSWLENCPWTQQMPM